MQRAKSILLATVVVALVTPPLASAAEPKLAGQVQTLLSGYEHVPTPAAWARLGPPKAVAAALIHIARTGRTVHQLRALASLGHFRRPEVEAFLVDFGRTAPARLRGRALMSLCRAFGDVHAPTAVVALADRDARLREDAVRALRHLSAESVERFLRARRAVEPAGHVRDAMTVAADRVAGNRRARVAAKLPVPRVTLPAVPAVPAR